MPWAAIFAKMIQSCLPRLVSGHVPIRLEVGTHCSLLQPFRFELAWTTIEGFQELVHNWWMATSLMGCGVFIFSKKTSRLRDHLRHWARFSFGSIKLRKLALLQKLEEMDIAKELSHEQSLLDYLGEIRKQEEL